MRTDRMTSPWSPWGSGVDERLAAALEAGGNETAGDVDGPGHYERFDRSGAGRGGYIVRTCSQGFRDLEEYATTAELDARWAEVEEWVGTFCEDEDAEHVWQRGVFTGTRTCARCGLLPLDEDDDASACPGGRT